MKDVFDYPVIARCQQHKIRNVRDRLPDKLRPVVERRMRQAYHAESALAAQAQLEALALELDKTHPGAAASLREGLEETLTMLRLGVPPTLARSLRSTNPIESMIEICREHAKTVEIQRRGVSWLPDLWGIDGSDRPVWRLEFQYRRAVLAEFNLSGVDETVASVQDLWRYGTEEWMSLRVRRKHSVRRRWPVDPLWEEIRAIQIKPTMTGVVRRRLEEANELKLLEGFQGYATSLAARRDHKDLGDAMDDFGTLVRSYLASRGRGFTEEVRRKQSRQLSVTALLESERHILTSDRGGE